MARSKKKKQQALHHISSAVVTVRPERMDEIADRVAQMPGVEVPTFAEGRLVVLIEGASAGELGDRLNEISALDGVISANMVYEQADRLEAPDK